MVYVWDSNRLLTRLGLCWLNVHLARSFRRQPQLPQTHDFYLSLTKSGIQLNQLCNYLASSFTEQYARKINLIFIISAISHGRVRAQDDLSPEFSTSNSVRHDCLRPFLFIFDVEMIVETVLTSCVNNSTDVWSDGKLSDFEYAGGFAVRSEDLSKALVESVSLHFVSHRYLHSVMSAWY